MSDGGFAFQFGPEDEIKRNGRVVYAFREEQKKFKEEIQFFFEEGFINLWSNGKFVACHRSPRLTIYPKTTRIAYPATWNIKRVCLLNGAELFMPNWPYYQANREAVAKFVYTGKLVVNGDVRKDSRIIVTEDAVIS